MSGFSFGATAGASQSTAKPKLVGNSLHVVKFDECVSDDIVGVKDPTITYKVLKLRFSNDDGAFEHTVFEPKAEDFARKENEITDKNGNKQKIPQPSNVESMMLLFKHVIDVVNPTVAGQIDREEKNLSAPSWDVLRTLVISILTPGKGTKTTIKLLKNKNGEAVFPGFFAGLTKEGKAYVRNNFIGDKVAFSAYEVDRIKNEANAIVTKTNNFAGNSTSDFTIDTPNGEALDMNFEVTGL